MIKKLNAKKELTKEQTRDILLQAQKDFNLGPVEMAAILTGNKKGYGTYKKWVIQGSELRKPTLSVLAHIDTLYDYYNFNQTKFIKYLEIKLNNT